MKVFKIGRYLMLGLVAGALAQTSQGAGRVTGFEPSDPALTGFGDVSIQGTFQGQASPEGTKQALATTISSTDGDGKPSVSGTNAVTTTLFNGATVGGVQNSGILIPFNVSAGDLQLTFQYDFLSNEPNQTTVRPDFAFLGVFNGTTNALIGSFNHFATASAAFPSTLFGAGNPFIFHSGIQSFTLSLVGFVPGSYKLGLGVVDVTSNDGATGLLIDNVQVVVPEPSTIGLIMAGAVSCLAVRRRIRK